VSLHTVPVTGFQLTVKVTVPASERNPATLICAAPASALSEQMINSDNFFI
jgi:hypothetical protein